MSDDPERYFELILWVEDGWLSGVEIVYYSEEPPKEFPPPGVFDPPYVRSS